jgi:hypothetical protein
MHVHHSDCSVAEAIFGNGTYFVDTPCIYVFHVILRINSDHPLNSRNWLVFVMEMPYVSYEVGFELFLNFM